MWHQVKWSVLVGVTPTYFNYFAKMYFIVYGSNINSFTLLHTEKSCGFHKPNCKNVLQRSCNKMSMTTSQEK